ncbi:MAG: TetR/AcrR family transcriptional regulator [Sphingobium sp.]
MHDIRQKLLRKMRPDSFAAEGAKWQQQKSGQTRIKIFEAAIDCIVEHGYSRLSIAEISARSGVSRGAMHHHFSGKMQLVAGLTDYLFYKRMDRFITDYFEVLGEDDKDFEIHATELHWRSVQTPEYAAYLEIMIAARTDQQLADIFIPLSEKFDRVWHDEMVRDFPQWEGRVNALQLVSDFVTAAHMGLLLNQRSFGDGSRVQQVYDLIAETVSRIRRLGKDGA